MRFDLETEGEEITFLIKNSYWFPFKTGNLKNNATSGRMINDTTYLIHFDGIIAPYVKYLEEGTGPHDIPRAFGRDLPFGIGGRFNDMFHPGSTKHQGFIKDKSINAIISYIENKFDGVTVQI